MGFVSLFQTSDLLLLLSHIENAPFVGLTVCWTTGLGEEAWELNSLAQAADENAFPGKLWARWTFAQASLRFGAVVELVGMNGS